MSSRSNYRMRPSTVSSRASSRRSTATFVPPHVQASNKKIQELLELLAIQNKWNNPGFSNVLGLLAERLEVKQFFFSNSDTSSLTFRYAVPSRLLLSKLDCTTTLSTCLSVVDDVTSWTLILASQGRHKHFVSGAMQAEWAPSAHLGLFPGSVVDVTARVERVALEAQNTNSTQQPAPIAVHVELRDAESGAIACHATQTKYMAKNATKSKKRRRMDMLLKLPLSRWFLGGSQRSKTCEEVCPVSLQMSDMLESLDFISHTRATFIASPKHVLGCSVEILKYITCGRGWDIWLSLSN